MHHEWHATVSAKSIGFMVSNVCATNKRILLAHILLATSLQVTEFIPMLL